MNIGKILLLVLFGCCHVMWMHVGHIKNNNNKQQQRNRLDICIVIRTTNKQQQQNVQHKSTSILQLHNTLVLVGGGRSVQWGGAVGRCQTLFYFIFKFELGQPLLSSSSLTITPYKERNLPFHPHRLWIGVFISIRYASSSEDEEAYCSVQYRSRYI